MMNNYRFPFHLAVATEKPTLRHIDSPMNMWQPQPEGSISEKHALPISI
jgi:hypothetical protein